jgi:hypothetical protein
MRSNGLTAEDYAPIAVLERSVAADALLALRDAGVAAYAVQPDSDDTRQARVFADRTALDRARAVVRDLAPQALPPADFSPVDEVAWQQIVSGFSATAAEPDQSAPPPGDEPWPEPPPRHDALPAPPRNLHPLVRDDEEHFVPEPPPPPPRLDLVSRLAWSGVFGGPLTMLSAAMASWSPPRALVLLCVLGFVGGMLTLVLRMKDRPPTDDGPDNGAVV